MNRLIVFALGLTAVLISSASGSAQLGIPEHERIVVKTPWPNEPVKVIAVKTETKANVEMGEVFDDDDEWLNGFTVTVVNNYHKTVTAMKIDMIFRREHGDTRSPFAYALHLGPSPKSPQYLERDPTKVINVGETINLGLTEKNYKSLKAYLEKTGYVNVRRVELVIREVGFEDGSMIYSGTWYRQDPAYPQDPTKKIMVPELGYNRYF
jgi:hypothetical protein